MISNLSNLEPTGRSFCLCGSGERFKNCCKNEYQEKHFDGWRLFNKGEYKKALISIRRHITWYRLCHMAHTVPFLKSNSDQSRKLLKTDIEALSDMTELLLSCYEKCGVIDDYSTALNHLFSAIDDVRWRVRIDYHKCIYLYVYKNEKEAAKEVLRVYDWKSVSDVDLLTVLIDVYADELNQVEKINMAEKVCEVSSTPAIKLQYGNLIGIEYCLLNDFKKGIPILENTIFEYEKTPLKKRTPLGRHHFAVSYKQLGELTGNKDCLNIAVKKIQSEISTGEYSSIGEAQFWFDLADCYCHLGEFDKALKAYDESLSHSHSELVLIFKARLLIEMERIEAAKIMLSEIIIDGLTEPNVFDFSISKCYLAIASKDVNDIENALKSITGIKTNDPMFKDLIQELLLQLYELKNTSKGRHQVETALQKLNRYISLKPNIFGFGIDINAIIDDIGSRSSNHDN
jgi:pentatricopeptide repeat protein